MLLTMLQHGKITLLSGQVQGASNAANIVTVDVIASNGVLQCTSLVVFCFHRRLLHRYQET